MKNRKFNLFSYCFNIFDVQNCKIMSENMTLPYMLQLKTGVNAIHLTDIGGINQTLTEASHLTYLPNIEPTIEQVCLQPIQPITQKSSMDVQFQNDSPAVINYICEVVYPEQLELKPIYSMKRGRPKKKKVEDPIQTESVKAVKPAPRTRSGRVVKFPKHIEKDFTNEDPEDSDNCTTESEVTSEKQLDKTHDVIMANDVITHDLTNDKNDKLEELEFHQRRRKIAAQYRCPKCNKAYLGKTKMIQHIRKYPDHGPLPVQRNELNFDVWNYLVDITQKCPPAQRGIKFCEELTNLLHNVLLLTSALFKEVETNKNHVEVDKVLGNAIGLSPGQYKFNDSELYKDVTVLKLITNADFFKPVSKTNRTTTTENPHKTEDKVNQENKICDTVETNEKPTNTEQIYFKNVENDPKKLLPLTYPLVNIDDKITNTFTSLKVNTGHLKEDNYVKKRHPPSPLTEGRISVQQELLSDNSLLTLPNLRDELMLTAVDTGGTLLDNSTSSDEVMNVDQFVNERFKKITEPEIDIGGNSLNLDLPSLDLFQFHTS